MKEGWTYKKLGEVCEILDYMRKPITKGKRESGSIPYYGATGCLDFVKEYIFDEKLVLLGEDGAKWGAGENSAYIIDGKTWVNNHAHALRPKRDILIDEFLVYYLNYENLQPFITGVTVPKLNQEKMRSIIIPVASKKEQNHIVSRLDAAFSHIDELKVNAEKQLSEARALFQKSLAKALEPKEDWKEKTLKEVCSVITDGTHHSPTNLPIGDYKYITAKNIKSWGLDLSNITYVSEDVHREIIARCNPQKGDVLYIKDGATTGIAIINPLDEEISILSSVALIRPQKKILLSKYLCYALNSPSIYEQTRNQMDGAAITRVTLVKIKGFSIPLPPLSEQQRIVERLDALSAHVRELEENQKKIISECDALKQALLRKVFE